MHMYNTTVTSYPKCNTGVVSDWCDLGRRLRIAATAHDPMSV